VSISGECDLDMWFDVISIRN